MSMDNSLNFSDMIASANSSVLEEFDASAIFREHPVSGKIAAESVATPPAPPVPVVEAPIIETPVEKPKKEEPKEWTPDADILADHPELTKSSAVVMDKSIYKDHDEKKIDDLGDQVVETSGREELSTMERMQLNLKEACARNGIRALKIPEMEFERVSIVTAAGIKDQNGAARELDLLIQGIMKDHPDWIIEKTEVPETPQDQLPESNGQPIQSPGKAGDDQIIRLPDPSEVQIIIDKSQVDDVTFSEDELEKIRKAHTIELDIRERKPINFADIKMAPETSIDRLLDRYKPKVNGIEIVLPASRYRCSVTGLSYPELLELSTDRLINTVDSQRSLWTICFNHIHNPSIGAWESYTTYIGADGEQHRLGPNEEIPSGAINVHTVTEFEDFMSKTSFIDQAYILWNILCMTSTDTEIITVRCHGTKQKPCNTGYETVYFPKRLLDTESISKEVSEEMEKTRLAGTDEDIRAWYEDSFVHAQRAIELPVSKIQLVYGHNDAKTYVDDMYAKILEAQEILDSDQVDPDTFRKLTMIEALPSIIGFLIPDGDQFYRMSGVPNIIRVLDTLGLQDWNVISKINEMVTKPYQFEYKIRNCRCPKCGRRYDVTLNGVENLLFMLDSLQGSTRISLRT